VVQKNPEPLQGGGGNCKGSGKGPLKGEGGSPLLFLFKSNAFLSYKSNHHNPLGGTRLWQQSGEQVRRITC